MGIVVRVAPGNVSWMSRVTSGPQATGLAPAQRPAVPASRLAWLDALRGFAALCVVFDHGTSYLLLPARHLVYRYIDPGQFGVFVFFLVSGYIVPASLERKGSVRSFWISRAFRLYPMFLVALAIPESFSDPLWTLEARVQTAETEVDARA